MKSIPKIFLDSSVIISAVLSPRGGSAELFRWGERKDAKLYVGSRVLQESQNGVQQKYPRALKTLLILLDSGNVETVPTPNEAQLALAVELVNYPPDARVLAEALMAQPDWFVTHDKEHLLKLRGAARLPFQVGTPGDFLQAFVERLN